MAVLMEDVCSFFVEESHQIVVISFEFSPERKFRLQIDTLNIGGKESSLRGAPGVEPDVVDAVAFADLQIAAPGNHIHRNMARIREYTGIMLAAQESLPAVDVELCTDVSEITYAEIYFLLVVAINCYDKSIEIGIPLVPEFQTIALVFQDQVSAVFLVLFDGVLHEDNPHVIAHRSKYS